MADKDIKPIEAEETKPVETETEAVEAKAKKPKKKKVKRNVPSGQVHVFASFNNTIVSFSDPTGNTIAYSSAGACGFRGSKKGTAYAAQVASEKAAEIAKTQFGFTKADVLVKGVGLGRDSAIRALGNYDIVVESITDVTGQAHGGVRAKRARRV